RVAACPLTRIGEMAAIPSAAVTPPPDLFPGRRNSAGLDLTSAADLAAIEAARAPFRETLSEASPLLAGRPVGAERTEVLNPATGALVGHVLAAGAADVDTALRLGEPWAAAPAERAEVLNRAADLYEENLGEIFALLAREA